MSSLAHPTDEPQNLGELLDLAQTRLWDALRAFREADLILDRAFSGELARDLDQWRLSECDLGKYVRRVERLREEREALVCRLVGKAPAARITVKELADGIGQTEYTTRKLLAADHIPGARRKTLGLANSPWIIPASAVRDYLAHHSNGKEK